MRAIFVCDDTDALRDVARLAAGYSWIEPAGVFNSAASAREFIAANAVDAAFLGARISSESGVELGELIKQINPSAVIIYIIGEGASACEVFGANADYCIFTPVSERNVYNAAAMARRLAGRGRKRVFIRTFGMFDVFVNDEPIRFASAKAKEMLAVLTDRRCSVLTTQELFSVLWEDKPLNDSNLSLCRRASLQLRQTLAQYGIEYIVRDERSEKNLVPGTFECDYYQLLEQSPTAQRYFFGEYMNQYSWAEDTLSGLLRLTAADEHKKGEKAHC